VAGKRCLDAGASTGGFTDVLLQAGAAHVVAADVGYGQLAWPLRTDDRVTVLDRVNVRTLDPALVAPPPDVVVADLSFISLSKVLPALVACAAPDAGFALMVKPQFEMGKGRVGQGGVVRSPDDRAEAVRAVCETAWTLGLGVKGVTASPLPGPAGNVEYFVWFRRGAPPLDDADLRQAIESGPRLALISRGTTPRTPRCRRARPDRKGRAHIRSCASAKRRAWPRHGRRSAAPGPVTAVGEPRLAPSRWRPWQRPACA